MLFLLHAHPFLIFAPFAVLALTALIGVSLTAYVEATSRPQQLPARDAKIFYFGEFKMKLRSAPATALAPARRAANGG